VPTWTEWSERFRQHLTAGGASPHTVAQYGYGLRLFAGHCQTLGLEDPAEAKLEQVTGFMATTLAGRKEATVKIRVQAVSVFYRWLLAQGAVAALPTKGARVPQPKLALTPTLDPQYIVRMLRSCTRWGFRNARDAAMIRLLIDTGIRVSELACIRLGDIVEPRGEILIRAKGGHFRYVPYGYKAGRDLTRYFKYRAKHRRAETTDRLFLTNLGPITRRQIHRVIEERAAAAGLDGVHPHMFRHTWAHLLKSANVSDGDLMRLGGWRTVAIMQRYGASLADVRAKEAHRLHGPGDHLPEPADRRYGPKSGARRNGAAGGESDEP